MRFKISSIIKKSKSTGWGQDYVNDCKALADVWDDAADLAEFCDASLVEIKAVWHNDTKPATCSKCRL